MPMLPPSQVLDLLSSLVDKSLVVYEEDEHGHGRYRLLEIVRQYGQDRLTDSGEAGAVRERHWDWFAALAEDAEPPRTGAQQAEWYDRVEAEHDNVRAALTGLSEQEGGTETALRLVTGLQPFWQTRGYWTEGRQCLREALERLAHARPAVRAETLRAAGRLALCQGDIAASRAYFGESLHLWTELEDTRNIAETLLNLTGAFWEWDTGAYEQSQGMTEKSLALFREMDDKAGVAKALRNLGTIASNRGTHAAAQEFYEQSLTLSQEIGDKSAAASALTDLGREAFNRGDYAAAGQHYEQSLVLKREMGHKSSLAHTLDHLSWLAQDQGEWERAASLMNESLALRREVGDRSGTGWALYNLGGLASSRHDHGAASAFLTECLQLRRNLGDPRGVADALNALGDLAADQGQFQEAEFLYEQSRVIAHGLGDLNGIASALFGLERAAFNRRDYDRAFQYMSDCLLLLQSADDKRQIAYALEDLGRISHLRGRNLRTVRLWAAAAKLRQMLTAPLRPDERERFDGELTAARASLSDTAFEAAWAEGEAMTWEQAVAYGLVEEEADEPA